ncbi:MAG: ABC transporter permease [Treponema sp.]|nr:ABC transporter permease [Treponema sp.]
MITQLATIAVRNIWRNIRRTVLCVAAVAIAVFFTIIMQSMMTGMIDNIEEVVRTFETGHVSVVSTQYEEEKEYYPVQYPVSDGKSIAELTTEIRKIPGVKAVLPRITAFATLQDSTVKHAFLWGIKINEEKTLNHFNLTERTDGLVQGRFPEEGKNECAIGVSMAGKTGLKIGDKLPLKTVSAQFSDKMWNPVITGIFKFDYQKYDDDVIIVQFDRLQKLLVLENGTQQLFIFADKANMSRSITWAVNAFLENGDIARDWRDNYFVAIMRQSMAIMVMVYLVFLIVASFLIVNTVVMIIHERIKEIGMMGSLGMMQREIVEVFFFEAVFLAIIGSLAGCLIGGLVTFIGSFFPLDFTAMTGGGFKEMPMSGTIILKFSPAILVQGFLFGVVISSICTLIPSLKSAFIEPVEALRR